LVAVAARDRARAEAFAAERGIAKVHDTYADMIADPDVGMGYNAQVNSLPAQWNVAALQAGKHVLSEKPLTCSAEQARVVRGAARISSGRIARSTSRSMRSPGPHGGCLTVPAALPTTRTTSPVVDPDSRCCAAGITSLLIPVAAARHIWVAGAGDSSGPLSGHRSTR
jgi:hypothetical protein